MQDTVFLNPWTWINPVHLLPEMGATNSSVQTPKFEAMLAIKGGQPLAWIQARQLKRKVSHPTTTPLPPGKCPAEAWRPSRRPPPPPRLLQAPLARPGPPHRIPEPPNASPVCVLAVLPAL